MAVNVETDEFCLLSETGHSNYPAPERVGGAGLVKSTLFIELSSRFVYKSEALTDAPPVAFD